MTRKLLSETLGTFTLVFLGTGAIVVNDLSGGAVTHLGVSLAFGLAVMAMAYALARVSGAHINPAVTLGFLAAGRFPGSQVLPYILSQAFGALAASLLLRALFPQHPNLGSTQPSGPALESFFLEGFMTLILMLTILSVSFGSEKKVLYAGLLVGTVVALEAYWGGPISGASMNPARSLGPALVSLRLHSLWIYILAPSLGALAAVPLCRRIHPMNCCLDKTRGCGIP